MWLSHSLIVHSYRDSVCRPEDAASTATRRQLAGVSQQQQQQQPQETRQSQHQSSTEMTDEIALDAPYVVVSAAVVGVWVVFFWKRFHMERLLGIHRAKMQ